MLKVARWKPTRAAWTWYRQKTFGSGWQPHLATIGLYSLRVEHFECIALWGPHGMIEQCSPFEDAKLELLVRAAEMLAAEPSASMEVHP